MIRKTVLLAGAAGALMFAPPALAQDGVIPPAPPASAPAAAPAAPAQLALQPGASVSGPDGVEFGRLDGAGQGPDGSVALNVRGEDGTIKAVPAAGVSMNGATIVTTWTKAQFDAAPIDPVLNPAPSGEELVLTPGTPVVGAQGAALGALVGAAEAADGSYNIHVKAADGNVKAVPAAGLTQQGGNIVTAWTQAEFDAAPVDPAATAAAAASAPAAAPASDADADATAEPATDEPTGE